MVAQGVSQTDASVTRAVLQNLAARRTSVCQMAAAAHCSVVPVDMGIAGAPVPGVQDCRIAPGTKDFTCGPAMTRAQAVQAIGCGIALVRGQKQQGVQLLATGEMGIGNTTTSSAVASVLLGAPVQSMTGRGAGLSDAGCLLYTSRSPRDTRYFRMQGLPARLMRSGAALPATSPIPLTRWMCWPS